MFDFVDPIQAKKNLNRQGTKVLHDIVNSYLNGSLDDPNRAYMFCSLLACICEGKVTGRFNEETMEVEWTVTPEHQREIDALTASVIDEKVIIGPWGQYEDR